VSAFEYITPSAPIARTVKASTIETLSIGPMECSVRSLWSRPHLPRLARKSRKSPPKPAPSIGHRRWGTSAPWDAPVYDVLRTADAVNRARGLVYGFLLGCVVYAALTVGTIYVLRGVARDVPIPVAP
jgi:hypothetical protein